MLLVIYFDFYRNDLVKRLNENNIKYHIVKYKDLENYLQTHSMPETIIITGSKKRILRENNFPILEYLMKKEIKIIGICYGFEYLAYRSGGEIKEGKRYKGRRGGLYYNHEDSVMELGKEWKIISRMEEFINIAVTKKWIGYQFHPEKDEMHFKKYMLPLLK